MALPEMQTNADRGEDMQPGIERRTYQRTSFKIFLLCLVITMATEYFGVSVQQLTTYADGIFRKTFENVNTVLIWAWPVITMIKEGVDDWRKSMHNRDIEIERVRAGK